MQLSSLEQSNLQSQPIIAVCCICKRIRTLDNSWRAIDRSDTIGAEQEITHTFCLECIRSHYSFVLDD